MRRRPPLVPDREGAGRMLPWVIAVMLFLAGLAGAGLLLLHSSLSAWRADLSSTMTVEVPAAEDDAATAAHAAAALAVLEESDGVAQAQLLTGEETAELLRPWLGDGALLRELPLPQLIEVQLDPAAPPAPGSLAGSLRQAVPGVRVDDHSQWLTPLTRLVRGGQVLASAVLLLLAVAVAGVIAFATRAAFTAHHETIEVLHLLGARDSFVASAMQWRAFALAAWGGTIGLAAAAVALLALGALAQELQTPLLPADAWRNPAWPSLLLLPLAAAAIALLTARWTVLRALAKLP